MCMRCDMGFISSQGESLPPQDGMTGESFHPLTTVQKSLLSYCMRHVIWGWEQGLLPLEID